MLKRKNVILVARIAHGKILGGKIGLPDPCFDKSNSYTGYIEKMNGESVTLYSAQYPNINDAFSVQSLAVNYFRGVYGYWLEQESGEYTNLMYEESMDTKIALVGYVSVMGSARGIYAGANSPTECKTTYEDVDVDVSTNEYLCMSYFQNNRKYCLKKLYDSQLYVVLSRMVSNGMNLTEMSNDARAEAIGEALYDYFLEDLIANLATDIDKCIVDGDVYSPQKRLTLFDGIRKKTFWHSRAKSLNHTKLLSFTGDITDGESVCFSSGAVDYTIPFTTDHNMTALAVAAKILNVRIASGKPLYTPKIVWKNGKAVSILITAKESHNTVDLENFGVIAASGMTSATARVELFNYSAYGVPRTPFSTTYKRPTEATAYLTIRRQFQKAQIDNHIGPVLGNYTLYLSREMFQMISNATLVEGLAGNMNVVKDAMTPEQLATSLRIARVKVMQNIDGYQWWAFEPSNLVYGTSKRLSSNQLEFKVVTTPGCYENHLLMTYQGMAGVTFVNPRLVMTNNAGDCYLEDFPLINQPDQFCIGNTPLIKDCRINATALKSY